MNREDFIDTYVRFAFLYVVLFITLFALGRSARPNSLEWHTWSVGTLLSAMSLLERKMGRRVKVVSFISALLFLSLVLLSSLRLSDGPLMLQVVVSLSIFLCSFLFRGRIALQNHEKRLL